jgi:hypothetical protein
VNRYLVQYTYPKGSLWAFVLADSEDQVQARFRDVIVYAEPPDWFTPDMEEAIQTHSIKEPRGWLRMVMRA